MACGEMEKLMALGLLWQGRKRRMDLVLAFCGERSASSRSVQHSHSRYPTLLTPGGCARDFNLSFALLGYSISIFRFLITTCSAS